MRVWIVNYYTPPPEFDHHGRHVAFARYLQEHGYDVIIITAASHGSKDYVNNYNGKKYKKVRYHDVDYVHIKCAHYKGNGLKRCFSIFQFAMRVFLYKNRFPKPDVILHNIHEPFDYPVSWCPKRLKAKYIVEDWDMWTRSFITMGFFGKNGLMAKVVSSISERLFAKADSIVFSFEGGIEYVKDMGWDKENGGKVDLSIVNYINNGVDLKKFDRCVNEELMDDGDLADNSCFKAVYIGTINMTNNLKLLIDAAKLLLNQSSIKFLIYGDGTDRSELERYCNEAGITNVFFKQKSIPFCKVPYVLSCCDLNLLNYNQTVGQYGLSTGKLFMYLASGKPICSNLDLRKYDLITKNNIGIAQPFKTAEEYADAIISFVRMPIEEYVDMCKRVREVARLFDYDFLSKKLLKVLEDL